MANLADETSEIDGLSFEEAYRELEMTVEHLSAAGGELTLAEAIALYERGMRLAQHCSQVLDNAELQVQRLLMANQQQPNG
jgi:exodeoxyribonuclease VII small subunit